MISILLSLFIFLDLLNLKYIANLGLLSAIIGLYILLKSDRKIWFLSGFFIGLFWFYWISFSLVYYNFGYLIPIEILGICLIYGSIFLAVSWLESIYIKAIFLLFASYVAPFGFDWLNFELIFVDTLFKPTIYTLALVLISIIISIKFSRYLGLGAMVLSLIISYKSTDNFESLPFNISLITTYIFDKGEIKRLEKLILVPFGEEIPLPNFIRNPISNIFFDSAVDYSKADGVSDYEIDGVKIRNAICYEATKDELFKDNPKFMIAISNNAWFSPSTQPNLQSKILKLKAFKYKTTIYHSINGSPSQMITP